MPTFEITGPDGKKYRVTGENAEGALAAVKRMSGGHNTPAFDPKVPGYNPETGNVERSSGRTGAFLSSAVEGLPVVGPTIQKGAENAAAYIGSKLTGEDQAKVRREMGGMNEVAQRDHPNYSTAGSLTGNVMGTAAMVAAAPGLMGATPGMSMGQQMLRGGLSSAGIGGADVAARGGNMQDVATGAALSGALGVVAPPVAAGVQAAWKPLSGMLGIGNKGRAQEALREALTRSGKSADDIAMDITQATADGQSSYALADALGNPGQRMLSGVVRSPGDKRAAIVDMLENRQAGQGRRIAGFLDDAFGSAQGTALQKEAGDIAARRAAGNVNYGAARDAAGAVDTSGAIKAIDDVIRPGVSRMTGVGAADNGVYATMARARSYLTNGKAIVQDFDRALLAKQEMDAMIEQGGTVAALLKPARNALDDALATASKPYAAARDTYRSQSKAIEAIDIGRSAAKRGRFEDTIPTFQGMGPDEQAAFRTGYVDPLIEQTQGAAMGVNKARPLINDAYAAEFPAFSVPGKGSQLGRRVARENTMFETRAAALGGSKTADNLADMADIGSFDPSMIGNVLTGNWKGALTQGVAKSANAMKGRNQATRDMIADALLQTSPKRATAELAAAVRRGEKIDKNKTTMIKALLMGTVPLANAPLQ